MTIADVAIATRDAAIAPTSAIPHRAAMSRGVRRRLRVARHIPVAVQPTPRIAVGAGELAQQRIVVARMVVVQPRRRVSILPGEPLRRRQAPRRIAHAAVGRIQRARGDSTCGRERGGHTAQPVLRQIRVRILMMADQYYSRPGLYVQPPK